jgi:formamidopyrimidine-DNA glycosylase
MPELPEVETVRRGLAHFLTGYTFRSSQDLHPRVLKTASIAPLNAVVGARIKGVNRRGKFLWFELDRDQALVAHPLMRCISTSMERADSLRLHLLPMGKRASHVRGAVGRFEGLPLVIVLRTFVLSVRLNEKARRFLCGLFLWISQTTS